MKLRLAAPSLLVDLRRVEELRGVSRENGDVSRSARWSAITRSRRAASASRRRRRRRSPTSRSATWARSAGRWPTATRPPTCPAILLATEGSVIDPRRRRRARGRGGGLLRGLPDDRGRRGRDPHRGPHPGARGLRRTATRSSTAARRTGRWWPSRALVKKGGDGTCEDVRIGLTHMGSTPLRATAVEEALRGQPLTADSIAAAAEQAAEGTEPPADLNASAGLQAPPGAGAHPARARAPRHNERVQLHNAAGRDARPWPARATSPTRASRRPPTSPSRSSSRCCWRARRAWARPRWRARSPRRPAPR